MSPEPERYPSPLFRMSPAGLPGLYVVLFVTYVFATLFVSRETADSLLLVLIGLALAATFLAVFTTLKNRGS